jgi:UDP:flavonoid glycosyltransferase YjiC (YdhE family)
MRLIDEHWIAYPQFIAGPLGLLERFKLDRVQRPAVRYLDVILSRAALGEDSILARAGLKSGTYVLVVPGGGTGHPGAGDAPATFLAAANTLAVTGTLTVFVGPAALPSAQLRRFDTLPQADLAQLLSGARLIVTNGGSTLLQAVACGRASIAIPIAQDQAQRIKRCVAAGVAIAATLDAASIVQAVRELLRDESASLALARRAADLGLADGIEIALTALTRLLETVQGA